MRGAANKWFLPPAIRVYEEQIRAIAKESVDRLMASGGECDFVKDFARFFPLRVIMTMLGVPPEDEPRMLKLTQELFGPQDPDTARIREQLTAEQFSGMMQSVVADFGAYFRAITEDRRRNPRDDLATVIANAKISFITKFR